ncbi:MAG: hypothetical protein E5Y73_35350 [Mesorhizobium sp.]|uniref:MAC/perforin domain-containing protein n=1 Tax=Mesorhizobium sp. TaxID=1871066 RepID=UPI00121B8206|nr:MAC/perforin domain-containing protein [Mesorhizobium sp.]TIL83980.1 MAG: hypothetical protein E5Y73_35350 [Mesorhizobium sp.]
MNDLLKGSRYIGSGFDLIRTDPLDLDSSAIYGSVFKIVPEDQAGETFSIPLGCEFKAIFITDIEAQTTSVTCCTDFVDEMRSFVSCQAEVPAFASFTGSNSYKEISSATDTNSSVNIYVNVKRITYGIKADFDASGLQVSDEFAARVEKLPVPATEADKDLAPYQDFIRTFGTHFAAEIKIGGLAWQRVAQQLGTSKFTKDSEKELKVDASVVLDESLKAGVKYEDATKASQKIDATKKYERTEIRFRGGTPPSLSDIQATWLNTLKDEPAVVSATLRRLTDLLCSKFLPNEVSINAKRDLLGEAIDQWINEGGVSPLPGTVIRYGQPFTLSVFVPTKSCLAPVALDMTTKTLCADVDGKNVLLTFFARRFDETDGANSSFGEPVMYGDLLNIYHISSTGKEVPFYGSPLRLAKLGASGPPTVPSGKMIVRGDRLLMQGAQDWNGTSPRFWMAWFVDKNLQLTVFDLKSPKWDGATYVSLVPVFSDWA